MSINRYFFYNMYYFLYLHPFHLLYWFISTLPGIQLHVLMRGGLLITRRGGTSLHLSTSVCTLLHVSISRCSFDLSYVVMLAWMKECELDDMHNWARDQCQAQDTSMSCWIGTMHALLRSKCQTRSSMSFRLHNTSTVMTCIMQYLIDSMHKRVRAQVIR